jgi:Helix-turn-helix domain of transposase family ISL3
VENSEFYQQVLGLQSPWRVGRRAEAKKLALGLGSQWKVVKSEMDVPQRQLRSELDFSAGIGFTLMMEGMILLLAEQMSVSAAARMLGVHDTQLWRVLTYHVEQAHSRRPRGLRCFTHHEDGWPSFGQSPQGPGSTRCRSAWWPLGLAWQCVDAQQ